MPRNKRTGSGIDYNCTQVSRLMGAICDDGDVEQPAKDLTLLIRLVGRIGTTANEVGLIDLDSISEFKKGLNNDN